MRVSAKSLWLAVCTVVCSDRGRLCVVGQLCRSCRAVAVGQYAGPSGASRAGHSADRAGLSRHRRHDGSDTLGFAAGESDGLISSSRARQTVQT